MVMEETLDFNRYIKDYESQNILKEYCNNNFLFLLEAVAVALGHCNGEQMEYDKTKDYICTYIKKKFRMINVSKKQISRLIQPRKNRVSKYAPVYLMAMYNILVEQWPESLHTDICCRKQYDVTYSEFALERFLSMKERCSWNNPNDVLIAAFDHYLGVLNQHMPNNLGVEFSNDYPKTKFEKRDLY